MIGKRQGVPRDHRNSSYALCVERSTDQDLRCQGLYLETARMLIIGGNGGDLLRMAANTVQVRTPAGLGFGSVEGSWPSGLGGSLLTASSSPQLRALGSERVFTWWMVNATSGPNAMDHTLEQLLRFLYDERVPGDVGDAAARVGLDVRGVYERMGACARPPAPLSQGSLAASLHADDGRGGDSGTN
jgi:hypothetical protein